MSPRRSHQPPDVVRAVEYDGLLHLSRDPEVADDPEAHLRRAWFAVKAACAFLTSETEATAAAQPGSTGSTGARGATDDEEKEEKERKERKEIERLMCLARVWQCSDGMGCSYGPHVTQQLDDVITRLPDPWARRTRTSTKTRKGDSADADAVRKTEAGAQ